MNSEELAEKLDLSNEDINNRGTLQAKEKELAYRS